MRGRYCHDPICGPGNSAKCVRAADTHLTVGKIMKKLKLEALVVESYETASVPAEAGTVQGNVATLSCGGTCLRTCYESCTSCQSSPWCC